MKKLFTLRLLMPLCAFLLQNIHVEAQTIAWNFTAGTATASTTSPSIAAVSDLVQGNNNGTTTFITSTSPSSGYAGVSGTNNAGLAARIGAINIAASGSAFVEFTLTPVSGQSVKLTAISFGTRSTGTGPQAYTLRSSLDAYASDIATGTIPNTSAWVLKSNSGLTTTSGVSTPITFRIYGYNGTGSPAAGTANWRLDDIILSVSGASNNADLSNLSLSSGTLSPVFASSTTSYTSSVANNITSITATPTASDAGASITVNGNAVTSGSPSPAIALAVGSNTVTTVVTAQDAVTTKTYTVTVTRAAAGVPTLTVTSPLAGFGSVCTNTTAGPNSFTLDGTDMDGSNSSTIAIAALSGFTYSETIGGTYTPTLSFTYTGSAFTGKVIYVKFNPTAVQSYDGNIVLSGGGVASLAVAAAGSGINTKPTVTTGASSLVASSTATVAGTINATGCTAVTAYGIEYSTSSGFPDGSGTPIAASNLSAGNYSVNLTGLAPNTRYYYKAYATNAAGTSYGTQSAFTCTPLPVPMASQSGLSYTQDFSDVGSWGDFFTSGNGANHFGGLSANLTGTIPDGIKITASSANFQSNGFTSSGGVHRFIDATTPTQSIIFLSTGSPDNTTSTALDFYMDFTGVNAGTLSFDYATINNSTGNRNGSLRVYATVDGTTFTELPFADVLDFTNNVPISGSKTNISLPAMFNNSATARLRFYYHNGSGNTGSGSRPKISIDNLNVTAVATTPCATPTGAPTNLTFGTITDVSIQGSFTAASPAADEYLVVASVNNSLTGNPIDGQIYNVGDNLGDGTVVARSNSTSFTATGLTASTTYYFFIFPLNSVCTGGPLYNVAGVLNGNASTIAGLPPCAAPASQPTNLIFGTVGVNSIQGSFTATTADEYLVVRSTSSSLSNTPVNAQVYNAGDVLGNGVVAARGVATSFTANGLAAGTQYYFFIFSINSQACINGPVYNINTPLTGTQTTQPLPPCVAPSAQPTALVLRASNTTASGTFTGEISADDYLLVRSLSPTLSASPADNTDYNVGDNFGGGTVVANTNLTTFLTTGLTPNTTYYYFVFAANKNCSGGTKYAAAAPLSGSVVTTNLLANNYYFGTLHSHSDYSDGNQDHPGYTPTDDYNYAMTAQCMDYLGISEHNHFSSVNNPGNTIANWHSGVTEATTFSNAHPNFLALYGMEWGVISGGGHVVIYGDGMDNLWGWESGSGTWGASNNYDVYVPKNTYTGSTGLFKTVNDNIATNTFATLAHPNNTDYNNIAGTAYDAVADNAITGTAVESGPATTTNTTYSNPGSSMSYLWYYQLMLSKGYHLGPTIDHDNHNTTFGHTTYSRTAIVAPTLTKTALVAGMRNMNFYATQDCDTKVDFILNTKIMGSTVSDRFAPNIEVNLTDATTSTATAVIRVMFGVPGSGILPVKIDSAIGSNLKFTDINLPNNTTGYYYIDITNGTSRIVTAPIWYNRNDISGGPLPIKLNAFAVKKIDNTAKISWSTEQEVNSSHFVVERSIDGRTWNAIATVAAAGNSSHRIDYSIFDNTPMRGVNYYRLKQVDKDAKYDYSAIEKALFNSDYTAEVVPNPAKDFINLYLTKTSTAGATIQLLNAEGKVFYKTTSTLSHLQISTAGMSKGLYFVKVVDASNVTTIRVMVQ